MRDTGLHYYESRAFFFFKGALDKFWSALMHKSQIYGTFIFPFCDIWRLGKRMHSYAYVFFIQIPHIHYSCIHTASVWISQLFLIYGILNSQLSPEVFFRFIPAKNLTIRLYVRHCVGPFASLSIRLSACLSVFSILLPSLQQAGIKSRSLTVVF